MFGPREPSSALRLILQPSHLHKFEDLKVVSILLSPEILLVGKFLLEAQFVKVPLYYLAPFQPLCLKLIQVLGI